MQHPIPRQITTFEFKLIGFLTLKQFIYLVVFTPLAFVVFKLFPLPLLNLFLALLVGFLGIALAFMPVNDRPLDVWIKNLFKRLSSPTQFVYHKESKPLYFLSNLVFTRDPHIIAAHVESKDKLNTYLLKTKKVQPSNPQKQNIDTLLSKSTADVRPKEADQKPANVTSGGGAKKPYLVGVVRNKNKLPLPDILVYVKDQKNQTVRLLKTNLHGVFATFTLLPSGEYLFELKDPKGRYFFDTMKKKIANQNLEPFEFCSKELI